MKSTEQVHRGHRDHSNPTNIRHSPPWHHPSKKKRARPTRKTRVQTRSRGQVEEGEQQPSEIVNVDEIPSPETTPVNPTPIVEEIQQPTPEGMSIGHTDRSTGAETRTAETLKEVQPENTEQLQKSMGRSQIWKTTIEPDESQMTISDHPPEGMVEDITGQPEWYTEEQPEAVGTSSQPPPSKKDKIQIPRSPRKKPTTEIILPCIPDGVQVGPELLGHIKEAQILGP
jgi:hypothetical protein